MRSLTRVPTFAGVALTIAAAPAVTATAETTALPATGQSNIDKTCGEGYAGYLRRPGKDALCLRAGTRTWSGFRAFECRGNLIVYFEDGEKVVCNPQFGVNFGFHGGVVKTVVHLS